MRQMGRGMCAGIVVLLSLAPATVRAQAGMSGLELYELGCASCHGVDGAGAESNAFAFDDPLPDFTDCGFASREPDADWIIVSKAGGPIRGFSESMPAFGEAFDDDQLQSIMDHIRSFCTNDSWPRGELNLPRPLVTEKAYPEDEWVWTNSFDTDGPGRVLSEMVYEKRFGPDSQVEVKLPFGAANNPASADMTAVEDAGGWEAGLGDIAVGVKHAAWHNLQSIFSVATEVILPTAGSDNRLGKNAFVIEPSLAFGQILPSDGFLHAEAGVEVPVSNTDIVHTEWFWRAVLGRTWTSGEFGRAWSPMVEILGSKEVEDGSSVHWDLVPQMQITLNTRQHIMLNAGVRFPINDTAGRPTQFLVYILWDWFDGGLFDGW